MPTPIQGPSQNRAYSDKDNAVCLEVAEQIQLSPQVDSQDLSVEVRNGIVHLTGSVQNRHMKRKAQRIAQSCFGVIAVENDIRVVKAA